MAWTPLGLPAFCSSSQWWCSFTNWAISWWRACGEGRCFSVGFGKEIFVERQSGTRWKVSWLPIGGYVKFRRANAASTRSAAAARMSAAERARTLPSTLSAGRGRRAGPFANYSRHSAFTSLIFHNGHTVWRHHQRCGEGSAAKTAGIRPAIASPPSMAPSPISSDAPDIAVSGGRNLKIDLLRGSQSQHSSRRVPLACAMFWTI